MTAIATAERLVIRDDSSYATLWSRLGGGRRPPVDFGREVVAAAAAGPGAGAISMGRAVRRNDSLLIEVVRTVPSADCPSPEASSHPVAVVAFQTGAIKGWGFVEREQVGGCGF